MAPHELRVATRWLGWSRQSISLRGHRGLGGTCISDTHGAHPSITDRVFGHAKHALLASEHLTSSDDPGYDSLVSTMSQHSFETPDWGAPMDTAAHLALVPPEATARGMFAQELLNDLKKTGRKARVGRPSYVPFKSYPTREYLELCLDAAALFFRAAFALRARLRDGRVRRGVVPSRREEASEEALLAFEREDAVRARLRHLAELLH